MLTYVQLFLNFRYFFDNFILFQVRYIFNLFTMNFKFMFYPQVDDSMDSMDIPQEVENPLLVAPDQESPSHILNALIDDCLYKVFTWLNYLDLLNVVKVCVRFQIQGTAAFASSYKMLQLIDSECDQDQMEEVLREFGSIVQSLNVQSDKNVYNANLFRTIIKSCSPELKGLILTKCNIQVDSPNFRLPFSKLESLRLLNCTGNVSLAHLVDNCPELRLITVSSSGLRGVNELIDRKFNKLERLYLVDYYGDIDYYALENFITSNPDLIELCITKPTQFRTSNVYRLIGQHMPKLRVLEFYLSCDQPTQSDFNCTGQLHSLEKLVLDLNGLEVEPLAKMLTANVLPINFLNLQNGLIDKYAIKYISQLKQITILELDEINGLSDELLIFLAKNLPNLRWIQLTENPNDSLTIIGLIQMLDYAKNLRLLKFGFSQDDDDDFTFIVNTDDYKTMVNTIRHRPEKINLRIMIFGKEIKINVDETVLNENKEILSFE